MLAILAFLTAIAASAGAVVAIGQRRAVMVTPWIVLFGLFVIPGPTASFIPVSAAWICGVALYSPARMLSPGRIHWSSPGAVFAVLLLTMLVIAFRSPERGQGIRMFAQGVMVLAAGMTMSLLPSLQDRVAAMQQYLLATAAMAVLVVIFRALPSVEWMYWHTPLGGLTIDPHTLHEMLRGYHFEGNNVLDPNKAGGAFVNANAASAFLSLPFGTAVGLVLNGHRERTTRAIALVLGLGMVATGSRVGLATVGATVLWAVFRGRISRWAIGLGVIGAAALIPFAIPTIQRLSITAFANDPRLLLWPLAFQHYFAHPVWGGGFGDWEDWLGARLRFTGIEQVFPPHNLFLQIGLWGGLLLLVLTGWNFAAVARTVRRQMRLAGPLRPYASGIGVGLLAMLFHSMFDNFFAFEWRIGAELGAFIGFIAIATATSRHEPPAIIVSRAAG